MVAPLLSISFCFLSFPRFCHSTLFHSTLCPFCLSFMEGWHGLLGFTILLSLRGPIGLSIAISYWALFPSFFLFRVLRPVISLFYFCHFLGLPTVIFYQSGPLGLISLFSGFCGPFALTIAYPSLSFISSLLVTRLFCYWAPFIGNEYQPQQT